MSTNRTMPGGWADRHELPKGPNGRTLCRWCNLGGSQGPPHVLLGLVRGGMAARTDPGYLREKVLERDRGICAGLRRRLPGRVAPSKTPARRQRA